MIEVIKRDGTPVRNLQNMLRNISLYYNNIPVIAVDGIFGPTTTNVVNRTAMVKGVGSYPSGKNPNT